MYILKLMRVLIKLELLSLLKWIMNLSILNKNNIKIMYMELKKVTMEIIL